MKIEKTPTDMAMPRVSLFESAMRERMTWGFLPLERHFRQAFDEDLGQDGVYRIRNCRELEAVYSGGDVDFTQDALWGFLCECEQHGWDSNHELADVVSSILYTLGFEWV